MIKFKTLARSLKESIKCKPPLQILVRSLKENTKHDPLKTLVRSLNENTKKKTSPLNPKPYALQWEPEPRGSSSNNRRFSRKEPEWKQTGEKMWSQKWRERDKVTPRLWLHPELLTKHCWEEEVIARALACWPSRARRPLGHGGTHQNPNDALGNLLLHNRIYSRRILLHCLDLIASICFRSWGSRRSGVIIFSFFWVFVFSFRRLNFSMYYLWQPLRGRMGVGGEGRGAGVLFLNIEMGFVS
jgi:hypothetical protein